MARRSKSKRPEPRRAPEGRRRVIAGSARKAEGDPRPTTLDDRPLALALTRDRRRLLVTLPHELWIVDASTLEPERTVPVPAIHPSVSEGPGGVLWLGGHHLHRASLHATTVTKVGTKLGGFVDRVCALRTGLVCGAGSQGEVLWDDEKEKPAHRRKVSERKIHALIAAAGGRAVWADGSQSAWLIDPDYPSGYTRLRLRATSPAEVTAEGITALGLTFRGAPILAARDGAVAWMDQDLRIVGERIPARGGALTPLAVAADTQWIYVLRPRGLLHRVLIAQPPESDDEEQAPLPELAACRLRWPATCMALKTDAHGNARLYLGGPQADGMLGRLWIEDPAQLEWSPLATGERARVEEVAPDEPRAVSFVATRSKLHDGAPLGQLRVDEVLELGARGREVLITQRHGSLLERPVARRAPGDVMPADAVLLPAMIRAREGTARPALLLWPGVSDPADEPPAPAWLTWGDRPRGWMPVTTPKIREQGWSRTDLFPWQVALPRPPALAGHRAEIAERWIDPALFEALRLECKRLLKVLW
ncbi:MAG: hypothetical protein R3A51_19335 [Nannocystaceae bacterium]|nr:hypothetical protein [Myxococcales bacterium]